MKILRRIFYSLTQQKRKTFLLFLIVFILGNILNASMVLSYSMNHVKDEFIEQLGFRIYIESSTFKYQDRLDDFNLNIPSDHIFEIFNQLSKDENVSYIDYSALYSLESEELSFSDRKIVDDKDYERINMWGSNNQIPLDFKNQEVILKEGRYFTEEELKNGANVIIVSTSFKYLNSGETSDINVGDKIHLLRNLYVTPAKSGFQEDVLYSETVEYEVIGLFDINEKLTQRSSYNQIDSKNARFYVPNQTVYNESAILSDLIFQYLHTKSQNTTVIGDTYLQLKNRDVLEMIITRYSYLFTDADFLENYSVITSDELYKKISEPVESIQGIANSMLYISFVCCVLILSATIFFLTRDRKYEMRVLSVLGEKKQCIILQVVLEVWIIGILAINLSMISGNKLGSSLSDYLIQSSLSSQSALLTKKEEEEQQQLLDVYHFQMNAEYLVLMNTTGSVIILLSSMLSAASMIKSDPKKIY